MHIRSLVLASVAALALTAPTYAAGYIPIGPKVYTPVPPTITPQPDLVIPQPDIVTPQDPTIIPQDPTITKTGGGFTGSGSQEPHARLQGNSYGQIEGKSHFWNEKCQTIADVNADCVPYSMNPGTGGMPIPVKIVVTPNPDLVIENPDLVTAQPDLVIPQPPIVTPNPPECKQRGIGNQGVGWYSC